MASNYRAYRGKKSGGCLIPVLIILCVVAAAVSLLLHRHLVYTPEGTQVRLPFSDKTVDILKDEALDEDVDLVIEEPEVTEPVAPETQVITYEERVENSVLVPLATVLNPSALDNLLGQITGGINTVVLEVKADDGKLAFVSENALAKEAGVNAPSNDSIKSAIYKIGEKGLNVAAQISCFRDNCAPRTKRSAGLPLNNGRIFVDNDELTWLDAYDNDAKAYIKALVGEVYDLGIKEVILTNLSFPYEGGLLSAVVYEGNDKPGAIRAFANELRGVADENGGKIAAVFLGDGGQTLGDFTESFYRIYVTSADDAIAEAFGETATRLVTRVELADGEDAAAYSARIADAKAHGYGCMYTHPQGIYPTEVFSG